MALVGGLSGLQGMLTGTSAAAAGNTSLGNVGMDQVHLAPNRSSAFMSTWQNDLSGNTFSANALTGRMAASLLRNQGFASRVVSAKVSENDVSEASRQVDAAYSESVTANRERAAVLTEAFSRGLTTLKSGRHSTGTSASSFEQTGQSLSQLDQISQNIARNTGLSQAQVANIAFGAAGHVGVKTTMAGLQANASAEKLYQSTLTGQEQKALSSLSQEQVNAFKQFGDQISQDASYSNLVSSDTREAHDLSTRLAASTTRSEQTQANLSDRASYAERVSAAYEKGDAIAIDMAQDPHNMEMFMRYSEQYGRNSAAAHVMMDAELARQGLSPNRVFSDGSALPYSFEDMRDRHQFNRSADSLNQDPASTFNKHRQTMPNEVSTEQPVAPASSVRSDIQERGSQIRRQTQSDQSKFEQNADIIETDDGTLASRKSQLGQAGKQVGNDAQSSFGDAKDAVKDLFKK